MHIAYLTQSYPPMTSDAARAVEHLARGMAERGHQTLVITAGECRQAYRALAPNLTVMRLASVSTPWRVGQRFMLLPRRATLREFRPELIHAHDAFRLAQAGLAYARRARIPALLTVHQFPLFIAHCLPNNRILRAVAEFALWMSAKNILPKFNAILAPTQTIAGMIEGRTGIRPVFIGHEETKTLSLHECIYADLIAASANNLLRVL